MTPEKIQTLLSEYYGISNALDNWLRFKEISIIYLAQDANIYIGEDQIFYLDTTDNSLNISESKKYIDMDLSGKTSLSAFPVHIKLPLSAIAGFISTSVMGPYRYIPTKKVLSCHKTSS